jgi:hypothetical protein
MRDIIKKILAENIGMINIIGPETKYGKYIDDVNSIFFQKLDSQSLGLYVLSRDRNFFSELKKVNTPANLKEYKKNPYRVDAFVMNGATAEKIKLVVDNTNEIIKLKYNSIDLMNEHLIGSVTEIVKKQNERNNDRSI